MPGPPPSPNPIRRNLPPKFTALPAEGRTGKTPKWPLADPIVRGDVDYAFTASLATIKANEKKLWAELWRTPQAVMWERLGYHRIVARYVRHLLEVENLGPPTRLLAEVRALEDRLGLTPMSMLRLQWQIVTDEVAEVRTERVSGQSRASAAKARLLTAVPATP